MDKTIISKVKQQEIEQQVELHKQKIEEVDQSTMHSGVFQALCQLRQALNLMEKSLNDRDYEKASSLGYSEIASEFIFLQRTLGGLQSETIERQKIVQDIAMATRCAYEDVAPYVEQHMDCLKLRKKSEVIDITIGEQSIEKLNALHQIRGTKIEYIIEHIVATALKENLTYWQDIEVKKPVKKTRPEGDSGFSLTQMDEFLEDIGVEMQQRMDNLY